MFRGDDLDTRLLRAMVIKGILEQITTSTVNLVNADLLAKTRGLRIIESTVPSEGRLAPFQHPSPFPQGKLHAVYATCLPWQLCCLVLTRVVEAVQRGSSVVKDMARSVCLTLSCSRMLHT